MQSIFSGLDNLRDLATYTMTLPAHDASLWLIIIVKARPGMPLNLNLKGPKSTGGLQTLTHQNQKPPTIHG